MSNSYDGGPATSTGRNNDAAREDLAVDSSGITTSSGARLGSDTGGSAEAVAKVSVGGADRPVESKGSDKGIAKLEDEKSRVGDGSGGALEGQPSSSVSRGVDNSKKKSGVRNVKSEPKEVKTVAEDYDSMLSEFDQYASKGVGEPVGYGYEIGDMVWGKVRSHPWWPGYIYNEAFASPSVWKTKRDGHVLVAFFGDSSYGWFELAELIPFAENFAEKSRQTSSRGFVKAVEEAVAQFSKRRSLGMACRCRNEFNFWPSNVEGYFVVDMGDYDPGAYSLSQINKSRENFQPKEMLSFLGQVAVKPRINHHGSIELIKNKATVLACRKALYEEFDETYAQAFGSVPERPPRPTMPAAVDPTKGPLSGPLVFAEALGKGKHFVKPTKAKNQMEDRYILKRRDESMPINVKKARAGQSGSSAYPFLVDGLVLSAMPVDLGTGGHLPQTSSSDINDGQHQVTGQQAFFISETKPSESNRKIIDSGIKKLKSQKQIKKELSAENATLVEKKKKKKKRKNDSCSDQPTGDLSTTNVTSVEKKKRKKETTSVPSAEPVQLPVANSSSGVKAEKISEVPLDAPLSTNNQLNTKKDVATGLSLSPTEAQQTVDRSKLDFPILVQDLHSLALDPFHGVERGSPSTVKQIFLKFRALVFQKSLVLLSKENEKSETGFPSLPSPTVKTLDKPKLIKRPIRPDDPTTGGKKCSPSSDRPEAIKKKRLDESHDLEKKKRMDLEGIKKKKIVGDSKITSVEKKIPQRPTEIQRENAKAVASKNSTSVPKAPKLEPGKRMEVPPARTPNRPTMLVIKFPSGAALPSGAELRAKFARFGPMDHSATRVFWKSYTCRLVFRKRLDAEAALKFAQNNNLFGSTNMRSFIKEVEIDATELEPVKVQKDELREPAAARICVQPHPVPTQLKSCLKKPAAAGNEEGGGNGNNGRGTRVKFVLGGEQVSVGASSTSYSSSMDVTSKNMGAKLILPPQSTGTCTQRYPNNDTSSISISISSSGGSAAKNDISGEFLNLLTRCSDVVNKLSGALGYVPYHSL